MVPNADIWDGGKNSLELWGAAQRLQLITSPVNEDDLAVMEQTMCLAGKKYQSRAREGVSTGSEL